MTTSTTPGLEIRPATIDDVPVILRFIRGLAEYEQLLHAVEATEAALRETLFGPDPSAETVLAIVEGAPVGFALFYSTYSTFLARPGLFLEDLYVVPEARGRGVGRALIGHLAGLAVARNYGRLEWNVLDWNASAIAFYESLGAILLGEWRVFRLTGEPLARAADRD